MPRASHRSHSSQPRPQAACAHLLWAGLYAHSRSPGPPLAPQSQASFLPQEQAQQAIQARLLPALGSFPLAEALVAAARSWSASSFSASSVGSSALCGSSRVILPRRRSCRRWLKFAASALALPLLLGCAQDFRSDCGKRPRGSRLARRQNLPGAINRFLEGRGRHFVIAFRVALVCGWLQRRRLDWFAR